MSHERCQNTHHLKDTVLRTFATINKAQICKISQSTWRCTIWCHDNDGVPKDLLDVWHRQLNWIQYMCFLLVYYLFHFPSLIFSWVTRHSDHPVLFWLKRMDFIEFYSNDIFLFDIMWSSLRLRLFTAAQLFTSFSLRVPFTLMAQLSTLRASSAAILQTFINSCEYLKHFIHSKREKNIHIYI